MLREAQRVRIGEIALSTTIAGTGPPLLLLHGFPDAAEVWRYQVPVLAEAGYTVIAPDMRGFGRSDAPADRAAYRIDHIVDDLLGLLRARDITQRVGLVGHDWGAAVGWLFCMRHADRVARFAALSVGHPAAYRSAGLCHRNRVGAQSLQVREFLCCCGGCLPFRGCLSSEDAQRAAGDQVALQIEYVVSGGVHGEEALGRPRRFEALHLALSSPYRLVRDLGPIVFAQALLVPCRQAQLGEGSAIGSELVRGDLGRSNALLLAVPRVVV